MSTISIQPANTVTGEYDVRKPLPYPFHIDAATGDVGRQDFWKGDPARLLGFQKSADVQHVDLWLNDWAKSPAAAVGMFPVFVSKDGGMYNYTTPISDVTEG